MYRNGWNAIGVDVSIDMAQDVHAFGGPGGWSDLDMLVVGLKGTGQIADNGRGRISPISRLNFLSASNP